METEQRRISKREFIARIATRSGLPVRTVSDAYDSLLAELTDAVIAGDTVVLTGFGRFYRQDHKGHKVRFGQSEVSDYSVLKFSASRSVNRRLEDDQEEDPDYDAQYDVFEDESGVLIEVGPMSRAS